MITIYTYDKNNEYLGESATILDPEESKKQGKDVLLMPPNSTTIKPVMKEGCAPVWNGSEWIETEDHRGSQYWPKGATSNSAPVEMKELGPLPEGASLTRPEQTDEEKAAEEERRKQAEAEAARGPDLEAAVAELGITASSDKEESDAAVLDLAAYAAELEQRIAKLEAKNG